MAAPSCLGANPAEAACGRGAGGHIERSDRGRTSSIAGSTPLYATHAFRNTGLISECWQAKARIKLLSGDTLTSQ